MKVKKGDLVVIVGSAEEDKYRNDLFEVISDPYIICDTEVVKMKCHETGKYFGGGYATEFLKVVPANYTICHSCKKGLTVTDMIHRHDFDDNYFETKCPNCGETIGLYIDFKNIDSSNK